jgi:tRNA threonylcarbamoyladenosine biosynthesis protein TsaB
MAGFPCGSSRVNLLAVDTSTEACSLALAAGGRTYFSHVVAGRDHTGLLLPLLHQLMADAGIGFGQLDGLVSGVGPGSFAGVRIGVGFIKGLALARDLPVAPVTSLASLAQGSMRRTGVARATACIDARMHEVYVGNFERGADGLMGAVDAPRVCAPEEVVFPETSPWAVAGTGWGTYGAVLRTRCPHPPSSEEPQALPEAADVLVLGKAAFDRGETISADRLEPVYLRNNVALKLEQQAAARALRKPAAPSLPSKEHP